MDKLGAALRPLGIEPVLTIKEIDQEAFQANPSESNRIWIGDRPFEEWLGAKAAKDSVTPGSDRYGGYEDFYGPGGLMAHRGPDLSNIRGHGGVSGSGASLGPGGAEDRGTVEKTARTMWGSGIAMVALGGTLIAAGGGVMVATGGVGVPLVASMMEGGVEIIAYGLTYVDHQPSSGLITGVSSRRLLPLRNASLDDRRG